MLDPTRSPTPQQPGVAADEMFHDALIRQRLPAWLGLATVRQLQQLTQAMTLSLYFRQRTNDVLQRIEPLDQFTRARLQKDLQQRLGVNIDVGKWTMRVGTREPVIGSQPVGWHLSQARYAQIPLLEAALRNFTPEQASAEGQPPGNCLLAPHGETVQLPSATLFADWCRSLDLGKSYQAHLRQVLELPEGADTSQPAFASVLGRSLRYAIRVDAHAAWIKGDISEAEHSLLADLCALRGRLCLDGRPVIAKRLELLGCDLQQIVVLDVRDERLSPLITTTHRVLVHIPGDPHYPWRAYPSLRHFANALGKNLRTVPYQRFFSRFVRRRDSQRFFTAVAEGYANVSDLANIALDEHMHAYPGALFDSLAGLRITQIKDDAAMIAVPTASLDAQVQRAHDQRLEAEGWALLNLAGMFVPIIGLGLLAVTAWELLGEVYHGIEAWHEGDTSEALDHLLSVASDVAMMAAIAAGASLTRNLWSRSAVVDSLVPARLEDGSVRLWKQDLAPFRSTAPPAGALQAEGNIHRLGDQAWVWMDGHYYPVVVEADGRQVRLRPFAGHAPSLLDNGAGAWRLWSEQPGQWQPSGYLLRRLGERFALFDDDQLDLLQLAQGLHDDQLRAMLVHGQSPSAALLDTAQRISLEQRVRTAIADLRAGIRGDIELLQHIDAFPGASQLHDSALAELAWSRRRSLFSRVYAAAQPAESMGQHTLCRQFSRLPANVAAELLRTATVPERMSLEQQGRVGLRLAEAARAATHEVRVARVFEALHLDTPQNADLARTALGLARYLPGAASGPRVQLFEGTLQGPLLFGEAPSAADFALVHLAGDFQLYDARGVEVGLPGELFDVLAGAYDQRQRDTLAVSEPFAHNLRVLLGREAAQRRNEVEHILGRPVQTGWFRMPHRLPGNRLGYPLSGRSPGASAWRGRPQALYAMVRALYPAFTDAEVLAWLHEVQREGLDAGQELARLGQQLETLDSTLHNWVRMGTSSAQRAERRYLRETLVNCWQRRAARGAHEPGVPTGYRLSIWSVNLENLPELPATISFSFVHELSMMGLGLRAVDAGFLRAFPSLRVLELSNNALTRLPSGLERLANLRELDLYGNHITLDTRQAMTLANQVTLRYLNLSHNPLGRVFPLFRLDRVSRLHLRGTGITEFPPALLDRLDLTIADLRDNQLTELPSRLFQAPSRIGSSILLQGNPLSAQSARRLQAYQQAVGAPLQTDVAQSTVSLRQRWLDAADSELRPQQSSAWDELEAEEGGEAFFRILQRLPETADFRDRRQALANRLFAMLMAMREQATLRADLFLHARENLTCQDSVALCFSNMEVRMLVWRARVDAGTGGQERALLQLGRQLWRLDQVDRIAVDDIRVRRAQGADPDEIEIGLAYRLALREALDLPGQPGDMLFDEVAGLDEQRVLAALAQVRRAETNEALARALVAQDFWQTHLEHVECTAFDRLDAPFHQRLEALMEDQSVAEGERLQRIDQLHRERQLARTGLMSRLTLARLELVPEQVEPSVSPSGSSS
ncbi:MAG: NEL-type E3 ubiquitin ligase domain-containing protein [Candidatus Pseudomonas phytovorans]|uniref:RING-type E3 ubiquitin transferase n=1 Tax=Candidatus Pseudomonas phytovorans TaxID=3121377 RepID=A0AAJ5WGC6_9PSED|nr:NEL-type E3 ubiquitin ligase domain-containing protein [Pseudomonas sp.]WEK29177.1 MAG: NEL-type E3 ubiquitin ligase domain-containing protein [Pseudomonas sp.]